MLKKLSITLLAISALWAANPPVEIKQIKKPPVDEGIDAKPVEDRIKGITFINSQESNLTSTLSLSNESQTIVIGFKTTSHVPLTCKVIRGKKEILSISKKPKNPRESRALQFEIKKAILQVNDKLTISNNANIQIRKIKLIK
ncbi:MAG: Unknown protein [uncultured Sulfurovum sp.]|uniref:Periplasmic protein n=1 Tax=uncultured Sulfurovum sp. TaxID=269237 RepID=A0A6S6RW01_9BACT|nr:MAG: Unknown protein [uncultured Sulfurovum sp.]